MEDAKNYTFLTNGAVNVPGQDDGEEFLHTVEAMKVMGINDEDMSSIWKVISASLLFGNMVFKQERNSDQVKTKYSYLAMLTLNRVLFSCILSYFMSNSFIKVQILKYLKLIKVLPLLFKRLQVLVVGLIVFVIACHTRYFKT